jgi:DNA-binding transcriptional regulator YiaG
MQNTLDQERQEMSDRDKIQLAATLAAECRAWRDTHGITAKRGAEMLGIPHRTLQNVEQSRGFPYPDLLRIGMAAISAGLTPPPSAP